MGGMAFCPSNHRNKENIYETGLRLFKWDVANSRVKEQSLPERGMCHWCVRIDRWKRVWRKGMELSAAVQQEIKAGLKSNR